MLKLRKKRAKHTAQLAYPCCVSTLGRFGRSWSLDAGAKLYFFSLITILRVNIFDYSFSLTTLHYFF